MSDKSVTERMKSVLGFDPARRQSITSDLLKEVIGEAQKERYEKAREEARVKVRKLMELREEASKLERQFQGAMQKFEKEAGKLMNEIEGDLRRSGGTTEAEPETETPDEAPAG